ncbi:MAG: NAD-dependent epimerase/dehydratase family protein [Burkholderiaceae bacterium]
MVETTQDSIKARTAAHAPTDRRVGRFAGPRILVVGCGDVGMRLVARLGDRYRIHALTHSRERVQLLRAAGAVPIVADLDARHTLDRLGGVARTVVHLAPPQAHGRTDLRTRALCAVLHDVDRLVYVSTSGVYGDCGGAWVDETRPVAPQTDRAWRRVDAERQMRAWARRTGARLVILRVPGIYAADRLPLARIVAGTPVLQAADDVYTNHIHADDLAHLLAVALDRGMSQRVIHAVDRSALRMAEWFDLIASARQLPAPPRVSRAELALRVAPDRLSFMSESRRLSDTRMRSELGMRLTYPTVREGLTAPSA